LTRLAFTYGSEPSGAPISQKREEAVDLLMANRIKTNSVARLVLVLAATVGLANCNLLEPEEGLCVPENPGTVIVSVSDEDGAGLRDVAVQVHDVPNCVGSVYSVGQRTGRDGTSRFTFIPAGLRRVSVTLPNGFSAGGDAATRPVQVLERGTVAVAFRLGRK